jgi:uncharacterized protein (TIGR03790 family)
MTHLRPTVLALLLVACGPVTDANGPTDDTGTDTDTDTGTGTDTTAPTVILPHQGLSASQLGVVINLDDPLSADIAAAYVAAHGVPEANVVALSLGTSTDLSEADFDVQYATLQAALPGDVQALLLTFYAPYRVSCMGTAAAFGLGFDPKYCQAGPPCMSTSASAYYDSDSAMPWTELGVRPTMMLSGATLEAAEAVIANGVASVDSDPDGDVYFIRTTDSARAVRYNDQERTTTRFDPDEGLNMTYTDASADASAELLVGVTDVLGYQTGLTYVGSLDTVTFRPGALADHLTSYGGVLDGSAGQMPIVDWLTAGATASYGTALEPCNYEQKFPRATVLWPAYFLGATAVEAYWRSVEWPGEGNFVGDPLARPFGTQAQWSSGTLTLDTTQIDRNTDYRIEAADTADGPWDVVLDGIEGGRDHRRQVIEVPDATRDFYRLVAE